MVILDLLQQGPLKPCDKIQDALLYGGLCRIDVPEVLSSRVPSIAVHDYEGFSYDNIFARHTRIDKDFVDCSQILGGWIAIQANLHLLLVRI